MSLENVEKPYRVVLFGRPNVGKSTLFNRLTHSRRAVVKDRPGVTRDIQSGMADWRGYSFEVFDTGGVIEGLDIWSEEVKRRALDSAKSAQAVLFILDGKYGIHPEDQELAHFLKKNKIRALGVVNKIDTLDDREEKMAEFYSLDLEELLPASFEHKHGLDEVLDWVVQPLVEQKGAASVVSPERSKLGSRQAFVKGFDINSPMVLTVVGKPNAGKSSLVNKLLGEDRLIVSPVAGTTVDSVTVHFQYNGRPYRFIDTAGLRRRAKREDDVERLSAYKSEDSIDQANMVLVVIDAVQGPSQQDARIVELCMEKNKAVILVMNKSDLAQEKYPEFRKWAREKVETYFHFFIDIPVVFTSAKTGKGLKELFDEIDRIWEKIRTQISTKNCNEFLKRVIHMAPAPRAGTQDVRFYYMTQTKQIPPSFMMFVNEPAAMAESYKRFVTNQIKKEFDLKGVPIRIYFKKRERRSFYSTPELEEEL